MNWTREKKCAVIGLARAGIPTARFLAERGNRVVGYDSKTFSQLSPEARALSNLGVELQLGQHEYAGLRSCHLIVLSPGLKIHHEPLKTILEEALARGTEVIGELELAARHCPSPMVAVTGTKGKSTTVKLIEELLRAVGTAAFRAATPARRSSRNCPGCRRIRGRSSRFRPSSWSARRRSSHASRFC
jgi:UDP-N-acetylmuramoylalanine--D-glutamate ligase